MGLDVVIGLYVGDPSFNDVHHNLYRLVQDCLAREGLPAHIEPERDDHAGGLFGRAYGFYDLAQYCRDEDLPYEQIKHLTCSQYQMIVPVDFVRPIAEFPDKSPVDYELDVPSEQELKINEEWRQAWMKQMKVVFGSGGGYGYYLKTPPCAVYLLSSQQLARECEQFIRSRVPDWTDDIKCPLMFSTKLKDEAADAAFVLSCCRESIDDQRILYFSG